MVGDFSAALSSDGHKAIIGSINHGGSLWDVADNKRLFDWNHKQGIYSEIIASAFSPEGAFAITADSQTMVLWNAETGAPLTYWAAPSEVLSVALTPNGDSALLGLADFSAVLFNVKQGGIQRRFNHEGRVQSVALNADGRYAITGSEDQTAVLWDVSSGAALQRWQHDDDVVTVAISADGNTAFSVAKYDRAVLWNTVSGEEIGELPLRGSAVKRGLIFTSAALSGNGEYLLTGDTDRQVRLWETRTLKEIGHWTVPKRSLMKPTSAAILALAFADDDHTYYAIASNGFTHELHR